MVTGPGESAWPAGTWFRVPQAAFDVLRTAGPAAFAVYVLLAKYADAKDCYPSIRTMARVLGLTRRTVQKAIHALERAGFITVSRSPGGRGMGCTHRYRVQAIPPVTGRTGVHPTNGSSANCGSPKLDHKNYTKGTKPERAANAAQVAIPFELAASEEFVQAWGDWIAYRRTRKLSCLAATLTRQLDFLRELGPAEAVATLQASIRNGWAGLFARTKGPNNGHVKPTPGQRHPADKARW